MLTHKWTGFGGIGSYEIKVEVVCLWGMVRQFVSVALVAEVVSFASGGSCGIWHVEIQIKGKHIVMQPSDVTTGSPQKSSSSLD